MISPFAPADTSGGAHADLRAALRSVVAIPATPFTADGALDEPAYLTLLRRLRDGGIPVLTCNGNTGEFYALSPSERHRLVDLTVRESAGSVVLAGVGFDVGTAVAEARVAVDLGADAVMVHHPVHPFRSQAGWVEYHGAIADAVPAVGIVPYVKDATVGPVAMAALRSRCPTLVAVKYAVPDPARMAALVTADDVAPLTWLCGLAESWAPFFAVAGATGFTSGLATVDPARSLRMLVALQCGDQDAAMAVWREVYAFEELRARNASQHNVSVVKEALAQLGLCGRGVRPPITTLDDDDRARVTRILEGWACVRTTPPTDREVHMTIQSIDPRTGDVVEELGADTTTEEVARLCRLAGDATATFEAMGRTGRAALLRAAAAELEAERDALVAIADRETALGSTRLTGELGRTCFQLRLFAEVVEEGSYVEATLDPAADTGMGPRPDLRRMLVPVGPVAVFGASNFPFAFSVPGGDTAATLAAGCPVVIKAHPAHPGTSELAFQCLQRAAERTGAPAGTMALVHGGDAGQAVVTDPHITAVGFTGSQAGGRALFDLASSRPKPIPFYGELGSLNPLVVTPLAAQRRPEEIARGYVASITLGAGQFCTKPGIALLPTAHAEQMRTALVQALSGVDDAWLLSQGIASAYADGVRERKAQDGVELVAGADESTSRGFAAAPALLWAGVDELVAEGSTLREECFGPTAVVVTYEDQADLERALAALPGSLAAAVHAEDDEGELGDRLLSVLRDRVGRVVWNGYPTGVAVGWAMTHGGPYPSSTSVLHTSVGATSIRRFLRPVTFQSVPQAHLPAELRDDNPTGIPRRVDGRLATP